MHPSSRPQPGTTRMSKMLRDEFRLIIATMLAFTSFVAHAGEWIADAKTGCQVWNANPSPGESISWSGSCSDGKATGTGTLQWYLNGKPGSRYEGEYRDGKIHAKGTYVWANGNRYEGEWRDEKMHGFGIFYIADDKHYLNDTASEIGKQYGTVVGLWRNDKVYKRFYGCNSQVECEQNESRAIAEENTRRKAWEAELNGKDPQAMYLKAGTYSRNGDKSKGAELYEAIIRRFPSSQWAVKASDQLDGIHRARETPVTYSQGQNQQSACEAQKQTCLAQCQGVSNAGSGLFSSSPQDKCQSQCYRISCN